LELLHKHVGAEFLHVPYKGAAQALTDLLGGQVDVMFSSVQAALSPLKAERLRAIAVTSSTRVPQLPDVPTMSQAGATDFQFDIWHGLLYPASVPSQAQVRVNK
jgi:tripartite-type tricarboxylate transporter receptor subunit TctC